jgi:CheY-like chemotaxis protein
MVDGSVLVIDDDPIFMSIVESQLTELGYRVFRAENGRDGMMMAKKYQPDGILLDRRLPTISGDEVLKLLKRDPQTRHIPVKMISVEEPDLGLRRDGAVSVIQKPIDLPQLKLIMQNLIQFSAQQQKQEVLLIEDDRALQTAIVEVMQSCLPDAKLSYFHDAHKALNYLTHVQPSIVIVDLGLPNIDGFDVIDQITRRYADLPIIVYTGRELTANQLKRLRLYADSVILKTSDSIRRLIDEVGLFLHRSMRACQDKVDMLDSPSDSLSGVEILLVDDDIRNLFSLKALLETSGVKILTAHNGVDALQVLSRHQNIRMVLTDIMMPEMDGYELIKAIRAAPDLAQLPVIALTAKVGTDEREKCIKVGADDYLTKPVEESMLLALLRVWVSQTRL